MSGQRKPTKKQIGFYAEPVERDGLKELAASRRTDVTGLLRAIARKEIKLVGMPAPKPKKA